jgi:hypothetical protein
MGVQPMYVKVSMSFDILGGHSLKTHIDKLQNATSFNFYANSTFYNSGFYKQKARKDETAQEAINEKKGKEMIDRQGNIAMSFINDFQNNIRNSSLPIDPILQRNIPPLAQ